MGDGSNAIAMELTTGGPNTHHNPHQKGAAWRLQDRCAEEEKNILETIKVFSVSDLYKYPFLHLVQLFFEYITTQNDFPTFV